MSKHINLINEYLNKIEIPKTPANLYDPIRHIMFQGGKRIRPELCLLSCEMFGGNVKHAVYPAIAFEMLHNFTLIHDDIMDKSDLRRGKPTVYKKWGANTAILSGDVLFASAYDWLLKYPAIGVQKFVALLTTTAIKVCEGQQMDMDFEKRKSVSIGEYLEMIRLKTAVLLAACLKAGAITANANADIQEKIYNFGINIGLAFQIQDDLLDVYGKSNELGKPNGQDIICGKKTFLSVKLSEVISEEDLEITKTVFKKSEKKINAIKELYDKYQIKDIAEKQIKEYYDQALEILGEFCLEEKAERLMDLVKQIMYRNN